MTKSTPAIPVEQFIADTKPDHVEADRAEYRFELLTIQVMTRQASVLFFVNDGKSYGYLDQQDAQRLGSVLTMAAEMWPPTTDTEE